MSESGSGWVSVLVSKCKRMRGVVSVCLISVVVEGVVTDWVVVVMVMGGGVLRDGGNE